MALMIVGIDIRVEVPHLLEIPIEVVAVEATPSSDSPPVKSEDDAWRHLPVSQTAADLNTQSKSAPDLREIADKDRQQKAARDRVTLDGDGTEKSLTAAPRESVENRDGEELEKTRIAPPGQDSKPTAKEEVTQEDSETTAKRRQIQCGANDKVATAGSQMSRQGQVLGQLTKDEANRMIQITQANRDRYISPDYVDNIRVFVHIDGTKEGAWSIVLLPRGVTVRNGSRVEFVRGHLDPSRPCHYIPNLVSRVL